MKKNELWLLASIYIYLPTDIHLADVEKFIVVPGTSPRGQIDRVSADTP